MTAGVMIQTLWDGLFFSLCGLGLLGRSRGRADFLLPLIFSGVCLVSRLGLGSSETDLAYSVLPIDRIVMFIFLFLGILLINSIWFSAGEGHTFFGTVAVFALFLFLRCFCLAFIYLCGLREIFWYLYGGRGLSLLFWILLWAVGILSWLRERLADGDVSVRILFCNTALLLLWSLAAFQFDISAVFQWFPLTAGGLVLLAIGNGVVIFARRRRIQSLRRTRLLEQYLPLVEELIEQVRARQHEYNNQMMAVSAALETANDLEEAKAAVSTLLQNGKLEGVDRELLKCDSKVIAGLLFGKIRQAEMKRIRMEVTIGGAFLHRSIPEVLWTEVIGILTDNAIEASSPGDVLYVKAIEEGEEIRFTVSNPHPALSNVEFVQMFRRGWSTKAEGGRGYGLFNIRQAVEQGGGKLLTRNETIDGKAYITIGVLIL